MGAGMSRSSAARKARASRKRMDEQRADAQHQEEIAATLRKEITKAKSYYEQRIIRQVEHLIKVAAGLGSIEFQSAIAADHLRAGAPLRKNRPARRA
jgi:osmotically-inducible protein OsmY